MITVHCQLLRKSEHPASRSLPRPPFLLAALLALAVSAPFGTSVEAQENGRITGVVTDESGAPVSQVQVYLPESSLGSLTRPNGAYLILGVPAGTHEIRAERIGLGASSEQVTVQAGETAQVNFQLSSAALALDEIVVTGTAGAARRREIGNTISQITTADLPNRPVDVANMLTAAAPGVRVSQLGGVMGNGASIRLRGTTSLSTSPHPLIYIDGVRMQSKAFTNFREDNRGSGFSHPAGGWQSAGMVEASPLNNINPNDIERIEIVKGSAATTLYGTDASAGVIQIFTKRGNQGAPIFNLETQQGINKMMKTGPEEFPYMRMGPHIKTGYGGSYSGSVRGGGDALQYFASGRFENGSGILPTDSIQKYSVRGNFTFTPATDLQIQWNTSYAAQRQRNAPAGGNASGINHNTYRGVANYIGTEHPDSVAVLFEQEMRLNIERFTTGGTVTYSPIADLTNRLSVGYDYSLQEQRNLAPFGFLQYPEGRLENDTWSNRILTLDYTGTYGFGVMEGVRSSFSWGGQVIGEEEIRLNGFGFEFPGAAKPTLTSAAESFSYEFRTKVWNAGFFFQDVFDIQDRYFLTAGLRVDGNSSFGSDFGLQAYPKVSASWVMSDEAFWDEGLGSVKLRAAWGKSGRAPGAFDAVRTWNSRGLAGEAALVPFQVGNPEIGPEITAEFETGFDAEFLDGRLATAFTYYNQTTTGALFDVTQIPTLGFSQPQRRNVGEINNWGTEFSVDVSAISQANWGWDLGLDVTTNKSKVVSLGGLDAFSIGELSRTRIIEGEPAPVYVDTWVSNPDEIAEPIIEPNHVFGPTEPTLTWAPRTTVRIPGGITLSALGEFRGGFYHPGSFLTGAVGRGGWAIDCWDWYVNPYDGPANNFVTPGPEWTHELKPETPALFRAACSRSHTTTGFSVRKADYFRLRNVSAQIPIDFAFPDRISNAILTLQLTNAWTRYHKDWKVFDPEMGLADNIAPWLGTGVLTPPTYGFNASLRVQF